MNKPSRHFWQRSIQRCRYTELVLRLVCWNADREAERRLALTAAGWQVDSEPVPSGKLITQIRVSQPDCVVIDLDRLPSHGLAVGTVLRTTKSTRWIPLVFLGGAADKAARVREKLPDASFGSWAQAAAVIRRAIRRKGAPVVVPPGVMTSSPGTTLDKKLGLKPGMRVALIAAPESFPELISTEILADTRIGPNTELVIWFIRSREELEREMDYLSLHPPVWVSFPKHNEAGFTQHDVRRLGKRNGLVDNKVCAIDKRWSAIRFARARKKRDL
jgi:hypothetical protein